MSLCLRPLSPGLVSFTPFFLIIESNKLNEHSQSSPFRRRVRRIARSSRWRCWRPVGPCRVQQPKISRGERAARTSGVGAHPWGALLAWEARWSSGWGGEGWSEVVWVCVDGGAYTQRIPSWLSGSSFRTCAIITAITDCLCREGGAAVESQKLLVFVNPQLHTTYIPDPFEPFKVYGIFPSTHRKDSALGDALPVCSDL